MADRTDFLQPVLQVTDILNGRLKRKSAQW